VLIPTFAVRDIAAAAAFYTDVLDFTVSVLMSPEEPFYAVLERDGDELHLTKAPDERPKGATAIVVCADVDALFQQFVARGLKVPPRPQSPVHEGPLNQTWGTREVYIDDPDGNTLCFQQR
jgi:catechol 2,3-dioxygenase-like lactoylglutathione lyase family enzyme